MPEETKNGQDEKREDENVILQVDMHCEGCKAKVKKALSGITGVEGLEINLKDQKVTVRGKTLDPECIYEAIKRKSGRHTILIHPDLTKWKNEKKQEVKQKKEEGSPPTPDPEVTIVLKVNMHCGACAKKIKRSLLKMDGVIDVNEDVANCIVTIKGKQIDANKVCEQMMKKSRKHCEIVPTPPLKEEKKEDSKHIEEKKEDSKGSEATNPEKTEGKEENVQTQKEEKKDEERKDEKEEKKEIIEGFKTDIKKYDHFTHCPGVPHYVYPPQMFSDENPNACSIM